MPQMIMRHCPAALGPRRHPGVGRKRTSRVTRALPHTPDRDPRQRLSIKPGNCSTPPSHVSTSFACLNPTARQDGARRPMEEVPSLNADSIAAIVQLLPLPQRCAVARVSTCWRGGALLALGSATKLDLRSHAKTLKDLQLAQLLARSPNIIDLNLHGCTLLTDTALDKVAQYCSHLVAINISCVPGVGADAVERMCGSMVGLQSLDLGGCRSISEVDLVSRFGKYMDLGEEDGLDQVQG